MIAVVGLVAYAVPPLQSFHGRSAMDATWAILEYFVDVGVGYHWAVLAGTSFVATLGALLVVRRAGPVHRETDLAILGGLLGVPTAAIWVATVVAVAAIGVLDGFAFVPWALLFGVPIALVLTLFLLGIGLVGFASGYAVVRVVDSIRSRSRRAA